VSALLIPVLSLLSGFHAAAQDDCTAIHFRASNDTAVMLGRAPPEEVVCYALTTLSGQRVTVELLEGPNVMFGIEGLVDARDCYSFTAEHKTYRIVVSQLMRSLSQQPFRLRILLMRGSTDGSPARGPSEHTARCS
jgi:hypothetical protein